MTHILILSSKKTQLKIYYRRPCNSNINLIKPQTTPLKRKTNKQWTRYTPQV